MKKTLTACILLLALCLNSAACGNKREASANTETGSGAGTGAGVEAAAESGTEAAAETGTGAGLDAYIITNHVDLPGSVTGISRFLVHDGTAFLCCSQDDDVSESGATYAAAMNLDDGSFERLSLEMDESDRMLDIAVDAQGCIWCLCETSGGVCELRHFDSSGSLTYTASLNEVADDVPVLDEYSTLFLSMDSEGNLCVTVKYAGSYCYIFDSTGQFLFKILDSGNPLTTVTTADGKIAVCSSSDGGWNYSLMTLDVAQKSWNGDKLSLGTASNVFGGDGVYDLYLYDSSDFLGFQAGSDEPVTLFSWTGLGLSTGDIHVCGLGDGRFAVVAAAFSQSGKYSYEYCIVELGTDNRAVLSMLSMQPDSSLLEAVSQFNRTNGNYRIELTEYFPSYDDVTDGEWEQALQKFNVELISGKVPDIIDLTNMPVESYLKKGMLDDLYAYIQNDAEINMDDYFSNILDSFSIDGKLPYITSSVSIQTIFADSRAVGTDSGWTVKDFSAFLDQYGSEALTGGSKAANYFLKAMVSGGGFVNLSEGSCNFDSEEFIGLLELARRINDSPASYETIASFVGVPSFYDAAMYYELYGGNLNAIGFPNDDGVYHLILPASRIGMSATGEHRDGAWEFLKSLLLEKQQDSSYYLPLRKESFEKVAAAAIKGDSIWSWVYFGEIIQAEVDIVRGLMETASFCQNENDTVSEIVFDEAAAYFAGQRSAEDTAAMIQSRAQIYVSEQYG